MESTPTNWSRISQLVADALDIPPSERQAWLDAACAGDTALQREVESLLSASDRAGSFLAGSALDAPEAAAIVAAAARQGQGLAEGRSIGPYRVVRELGRGGMGIVYLAARADDAFERQVAIKVVRRGLADPREARRVDEERRILAALDHPNIARLLDAGIEDDGISYLVMEYVDGQPFDAYCESRALPLRERLLLFRQVCSAVDYAHKRLVIHRDIKPHNILVASDGTPKLLDFGIARLISGDGTQDQTRTVQRAFTLENASPEQVRGEPMTVTSDVYSLGVLLYRAVTGAHPYGGGHLADTAYVRAICEEPPASPADVARRVTGLRVSPELEWVILQALRKEPDRRYASAEHFSEDIRRLLEGLPVQAAPDSRWYRTRKFVGRHRLGLAATALLAVSLVGGITATLWQARQADTARQLAERRLTNAQELATSMVFEVNDALEQGPTAARALLLKRAAEQLDALAAEAGDDVALLETLASAYHRLGDVLGLDGSAHVGDREAGRASHHKGLALRRRIVASRSADTDARQHLVQSLIGTTYSEDEVEPSLRYGREAVTVAERLMADAPGPLAHRRALANAYYALASQFRVIGDNTQALPLFEKAAPLYEAAYRERPAADTSRELALVNKRVGAILLDSGQPERAMRYLRQAVALDEEALAGASGSVARRRDLSTSLTQLGTGLQNLGNLPEAIATFARSVELRTGIYAEDPTNVQAPRDLASALRYLGEAHARAGHADQAIVELTRSLATVRVARKDDNLLALVLHSLAEALQGAGRRDEAVARWRETIDAELALVRVQPANRAFRRNAARSGLALATLLRETRQTDRRGAALALAEACDAVARAREAFEPVASSPEDADRPTIAALTVAAASCPGVAAASPAAGPRATP